MTRILSAKGALDGLKNGTLKDFFLISIRDKESCDSGVYDAIDKLAMKGQCLGIHSVVMHDVKFGESVLGNIVFPSVELVSPALEFAKGKFNVAVHCTAGVSRSSAMAFLVELQKTGDADEAVKCLDKKIHYPNMAIIMIGEHILDIEAEPTIIEFNRSTEEAIF